jgi:hypothetical protein
LHRPTQETLGVPSALITLVCFLFQHDRFAKFFNDWQVFETRVHYVAAAAETFSSTARKATYALCVAVVVPWTLLLSTRAGLLHSPSPSSSPVVSAGGDDSQQLSSACSLSDDWLDLVFAVTKAAVRVAGAHYVDACFVYLVLSVATAFGALKKEIVREFRSHRRQQDHSRDDPRLLLRRIAQAKRTYLDLCRFAEDVNALFTPQLLFTVAFLTYFCISTLYLAVILASFGGHPADVAAYVYVFLEVTVRIVACSSAGHALTAQVR